MCIAVRLFAGLVFGAMFLVAGKTGASTSALLFLGGAAAMLLMWAHRAAQVPAGVCKRCKGSGRINVYPSMATCWTCNGSGSAPVHTGVRR